MKMRRRSLLLCGLILLLMVCGATLAASRAGGETKLVPVMDCTADCVARRDSSLERCNQMPSNFQQRCRDNASKQYDRCIESCKGGSSSAPQKNGR